MQPYPRLGGKVADQGCCDGRSHPHQRGRQLVRGTQTSRAATAITRVRPVHHIVGHRIVPPRISRRVDHVEKFVPQSTENQIFVAVIIRLSSWTSGSQPFDVSFDHARVFAALERTLPPALKRRPVFTVIRETIVVSYPTVSAFSR